MHPDSSPAPVAVASLHADYMAERTKKARRDARMRTIKWARSNEYEKIAPDLFPESGPWTGSVIANQIDIAARKLGENIAPLPTVQCVSARMVDEKDQVRAALRTKIANSYLADSRLAIQMRYGSEWFPSYGFLPGVAEDTPEGPRIRLVNPEGVYPVFDNLDRLIRVYHVLWLTERQVADLYPHLADLVVPQDPYSNTPNRAPSDTPIEVVFFHDAKRDAAWVPSRGKVDQTGKPEGLLVYDNPNPYGRVMWRVAKRPGMDPNDPQGEFDGIVPAHLFRHSFSLLKMELASKAVRAPIAAPRDVGSLTFGPDEVVQSSEPDKIRRVQIDVPASAWAADSDLEREVRIGARHSEAQDGISSASIITGAGVRELSASFDTQIEAYQAGLAAMVQELVSLCFLIDEHHHADETKKIRGYADGSPFELSYKPSRDIKGDYTCEASYGLATGLDPNRALIFALQAGGAGYVSKETARRMIPGNIDGQEEDKKIRVETFEDTLMAAVQQVPMLIPQFVASGQDPAEIVAKIAGISKGVAEGKPMADLVLEAFGPKEPEPAPELVEGPGGVMVDPTTGLPVSPGGPEVGPGQGPGEDPRAGFTGAPVEGRPDMMQLLAGLTGGGSANLQANVSRSVAL